MGDDAVVGNGPAVADVADQGDDRRDLGLGKQPIAELMARIDDLYADGGGVAVVLAAPAPRPGMPGAPFFGHKLEDPAVLLDQIMGRHLGLGVAQPRQGGLARLHAGIVQHQHVGRRPTRVEVRRGRRNQVNHGFRPQRPWRSQP